MGPITAILKLPRAVPLADRTVKVSEFTLRDLAALQAILDEMSPDPLAAYEAADHDTRQGRHKALVAAYEAAEAGPPVYAEDSGRAFFRTADGSALWLWYTLNRHQEIEPAEAARLYRDSTPAEFNLVWRIAHGISPLRSLGRLLMPGPWGAGAGGQDRTWPELIDQLAEARGWTYEQIFDLTLSQWVYARNCGQTPSVERTLQPGEDWGKIVEFQRRYWAGEVDEDGHEVTPEPAANPFGGPRTPAPPAPQSPGPPG